MKIVTRFISIITAAVLALTAVMICAGAESFDERSCPVKSGEKYAFYYKKTPQLDEYDLYYRFDMEEPGTMTLDVSHDISSVSFLLYDPHGTVVKYGHKIEASIESDYGDSHLGENRGVFRRSRKFEKSSGRFTVELKYSGTYYLVMTPGGKLSGKVNFTVTTPSADSSETSEDDNSPYLTSVMEIGTSAELVIGSTGCSSGDESWYSTDPSIVSVDSSGMVYAKKKGTASIIGQLGSKVMIFVVKVVDSEN